MTTREVDVLFNTKSNTAGADKTVSALQRIEQQADRTRNKMQKLAQVGQTMTFAGGAILAPLALAMKKYVDAMKDTEPTSARLVALSKRWEDSQVRIGRVTAEVVLPALEKALDIVDKIAAFTEKNPGFVQSALGIGGSLVILGGLLSTTAKIISAIAVVQSLAAGFGVSASGGAVAAGIAGAGAAAGGLGASIAAAISAAAPFVLIAAAVVAAAEGTRLILNWALGTNTTWKDIGTTASQLLFITGEGWKVGFQIIGTSFDGIIENSIQIADKLSVIISTTIANAVTGIGRFFSSLMQSIYNSGVNIVNGVGRFITGLGTSFRTWITELGNRISSGIAELVNRILSIIPGHAAGGYTTGLVRTGEAGREFILSHQTTRAAEQMIGGNLTQQRYLQALAGRSASVYQNLRFSGDIGAADKREIRNIARQSALDGIAEAFG